MKHKPVIYRILSILFLIEPLIKVLYFKVVTNFDLSVILTNLSERGNFREVFDFWLVFPIAGLMLLRVRKWTYFVFLGLLGYLFFSIMTYEEFTWPYNSSSPLFYHYLIVFLSIAAFTYFLIPSVREPFFDRRLRWWENKPRYKTLIPGQITDGKMNFPTEILDISQTGAFIKDSEHLNLGEIFFLECEFQGVHLSLAFEVISKHMVSRQIGFGIQFRPSSILQKVKIYKFIQRLKSSGTLS